MPSADQSLTSLLAADVDAHFRQFAAKRRRGPLLDLLTLVLNPYFCPVLLCRLAHAVGRRRIVGPLGLLFARANYFLFGIEIARQTRFGPGLFFPHTRGTVIGARQIGSNAVIYHGVTLGARTIDTAFGDDARPTVGDDVVIGAGAKIVGGVVIGDGARIGPNAVVVNDVPPGALIVAAPSVRVGE